MIHYIKLFRTDLNDLDLDQYIVESNWNEVVESFDAMNLKESLLRGVYSYGFEKPSAIQQRAIVPCIQGRDIIAQAQSGIVNIKNVYTFLY